MIYPPLKMERDKVKWGKKSVFVGGNGTGGMRASLVRTAAGERMSRCAVRRVLLPLPGLFENHA